MEFLALLIVALMAVLKVLLLVFFVFNPAYMMSSLSETVTFKSLVTLLFLPVNLLVTLVIGSALAWILIKITQTPPHLQGLVIGCCSSGNYIFLLIIAPAVCELSNGAFGDPSACSSYGNTYALLSMAVGAIYLWTFVYAIMGRFVNTVIKNNSVNDDSRISITSSGERSSGKIFSESCCSEPLLASKDCTRSWVPVQEKVVHCMKILYPKKNLKTVFNPSTIAAIVGLTIGIVSPIRKAMIGVNAPLRFIHNSASLLGEAAIPSLILILGANLLKGLKGSGVGPLHVIGIIALRYILMPLLGIVVVKGACHFGIVASDSLYQFILLLQFAVPPAMALGSITQLFEVGVSESSVILLWTYAMASIALPLWSAIYMWLLT